jgi:hypothetical protein
MISVDLVGSTALKQRGGIDALDTVRWVHWFNGFYDSFQEFLRRQYDQLPDSLASFDWVPDERPRLWKRNGDELLLHVQVKDHREALVHLVALRHALAGYREHWASALPERTTVHEAARKREFPMDLKATAWVAGFPVTNIGVPWDDHDPADFIGPQIDLGFRLAKRAARDRIVLDLGLALLLATAMNDLELADSVAVLYTGTKELADILEGLPYPIFAVDVPHPVDEAAKALAGGPVALQASGPAKVVTYAEEFLRHSHGLVRPFIYGDDHFRLEPRWHARLEKERDHLIGDYQAATGDSVSEGTAPATTAQGIDEYTTLDSPQ